MEKTTSSTADGLTMDKIIEKIIPAIGALFMTVGLWYLLYTNIWVHLALPVRLWLGFFLSIAIIGGGFSFSDKLKYFADITIGAGILLLYGTLIYGSRTTDLAQAVIPEQATLITAFLFTGAIGYFASMRKSAVILILGMIGAYITPFVIGQNHVWAQNVSFNAYLIYFAAVNLTAFLLGREISVRNIIPLNIGGLFLGTSTLYVLSSVNQAATNPNFFSSELFSGILFLLLAILAIGSILLSAKRFGKEDEWYLALGYLAPLLWFMWNISQLSEVTMLTRGILYAVLSIGCFIGWFVLRNTQTRFQHTALYADGIIAAIFAFFAFFPDLNTYSSLAIAYASLIFGGLFLLDSSKGERLVSYGLLSLVGSILSIIHIYEESRLFPVLLVVISLIPAMLGYFFTQKSESTRAREMTKFYSISAAVFASMFVLHDVLDLFNIEILVFFVAPLIVLLFLHFSRRTSHNTTSALLILSLIWFAFGYIGPFLGLVGSVYPAPVDTHLIIRGGLTSDLLFSKWLLAVSILFIGLAISRRLQEEQETKRPSFLLVIFGYASLLLVVNYIILAVMNDFAVPMGLGGPRAIATTLWWIILALFMLTSGIMGGARYKSEKFLGLLLLGLTIGKVLLYDLATMGMQNKIIVLMVVGGLLLFFSYGVQTKGWLRSEKVTDKE